MNPLQKRIEEIAAKRAPIKAPKECGSCTLWKSNKNDRLEREHAMQGRSMCANERPEKGMFFYHKTPACDRHVYVDVATQMKRNKFLEGK